jgi:hypothetical protein
VNLRVYALTEEHRLRALRRAFGHRREARAGEWRRLHNEELHKLYSSPQTHEPHVVLWSVVFQLPIDNRNTSRRIEIVVNSEDLSQMN